MPDQRHDTRIKFSASPAVIAALPKSLVLRAVTTGPGAWDRVERVIFETDNRDLERAGVCLSLKTRRGAPRQVIRYSKNGLSKVELTSPLSHIGEFPVLTGEVAFDSLIARLRPELQRAVVLNADQWRVAAKFGESQFDVAVNIGRAEKINVGASRQTPLANFVLSLTAGDTEDLFDFARLITRHVAVRVSLGSAYSDAMRLAQDPSSAIGKHPRFDFLSDMPAGYVLRKALQASAERLSDLHPFVADMRMPEALRQMRVALRRFRSIERVFRPWLGTQELRDLARRAQYYGRILGRARDWDVFFETTLTENIDAAIAGAGGAHLKQIASQKRAEHWAEAVDLIGDNRFAEFVLDILEASHFAGFESALETPVAQFAPIVLDRARRRARRVARGVDLENAAAMHRLRIALKKLRYPIQMFRPLYSKESRKPYMQAMRELQDGFGILNDAVVARRLADEAASGGGTDAAYAGGLIAGFTLARADAYRRRIGADWRRFDAMAPFWRN